MRLVTLLVALLMAIAAAGCETESCPRESAPPPPVPPADAREYLLPFAAGERLIIGQGSFGVFGLGSHACEYAIDFVMTIDTPVLAARGGRVVDVREDCPNVNCPFDPASCCGNYVLIEHADGTQAIYAHLVQFGACVEVDADVAQGDVIGRSGNTGYSIAPHLHFAVYAANRKSGGGSRGPSSNGSIETRFADVPGDGIPRVLQFVTSENAVAKDWCR